jgi:uncharacterized RDD family membrane protein YckC
MIVHLASRRAPSLQKNIIARMKAFGVDLAIIAALKVFLFFSYQEFLSRLFPTIASEVTVSLIESIYQQDLFYSFLVTSGYFTFSLYINQGKTLGMKLFHILKVHNNFTGHKDHQFELSLFESFLCSLSAFLSISTLGLTAALALIRNDGKTLGDFFSRTQVITTKEFHHHYMHMVYQSTKDQETKLLPAPQEEQEDLAA